MESKSRILLTVDWDYFVREDPTWDLGHIETPFFADFMWVARAASFAAVGMDLREEMNPYKWGTPPPYSFWKVLQERGFDFSNVKTFVVSDSHLAAGVYFLDPGPAVRNTKVVSFDAHHDCGYNKTAPGIMTCDNWLKRVLLYNHGLKAKVVFPPWKGMRDWNWQSLPKKIVQRVKPVVYGHPDDLAEGGVVEKVVLSRSSAWTPPFYDNDFIEFVKDAEHRFKQTPTIMRDDMYKFDGGVTGMKGDPMVPRRFDAAEYDRIRALGASTASALEAMRQHDGTAT